MLLGYLRGYRGLRLGTRLALGLGVLALIVFAVIGTAMTTYMRGYLKDQLGDQMRLVQSSQVKDAQEHWTVQGKRNYRWFTAVYDVTDQGAVLRNPSGQVEEGPDGHPVLAVTPPDGAAYSQGPEDSDGYYGSDGSGGSDGSYGSDGPDMPDVNDVPADSSELAATATSLRDSGKQDTLRTADIKGEGTYLVRACEVMPNVVLVSAAPMDEIDETMGQLVTVLAVTFAIALLTLVVVGRAVLRRGLRPFSEMASTAHGITSHDLTDSDRLAVRVDSGGGGPEVEELRHAFNTMLAHIDGSLAVRAETEQRLRRFIADASHELRTPLTSVRGYADLFQYAAANEPEERDQHLARLRSEAARMSVLLDDLLLLARLDAEEADTPLRPEDADLAELVRQAADAFRAGHPEHPLTVTVEPDRLPLHVDPLRVRQVLDNLLANAAVHTPSGTDVSVAVSATPETAVVRVTDTGPGIPPEDQARIFDRFYRVDPARNRERGGSGLGLAVAWSLIRAHRGTIAVTSRPGDTTFTVKIPRRSHPK
ncbi:HAMP domain-containing histidine kinase [Streptomycetaceae bacterium NBC_01309]